MENTKRPVRPSDKYWWHVGTVSGPEHIWGAYISVGRNGALSVWGVPGRGEPQVFAAGTWTDVIPEGVVPDSADSVWAKFIKASEDRDGALAMEAIKEFVEQDLDIGEPPGHPIDTSIGNEL
jgi:hypothetical protein